MPTVYPARQAGDPRVYRGSDSRVLIEPASIRDDKSPRARQLLTRRTIEKPMTLALASRAIQDDADRVSSPKWSRSRECVASRA